MNRRIFFWGSKSLGLKCFKYLIDLIKNDPKIHIVGVCISNKDIKKDGIRGQNIKKIALINNIPLFTEESKVNVKADLGICIGFPHKIDRETISKIKNGIINLHFAPLPYYRGSKTLNHAILNEEKRYGISLHYIDGRLDTGPIIKVKWFNLPNDSSVDVITKYIENLSYKFFKSFAKRIIEGRVHSKSQKKIIEERQIKPKFYTRNSLDNLYKLSKDWDFEKIYRHVRALACDKKKPYFEQNNQKIYLSIR